MAKSSGQPLKIGFVLDGGLKEPYGIQQYILTLGEYYKSLGHNIRYLVPGRVNYGKSDATSLPYARRAKFKHYMNSEQFDLLHVQAPYLPSLGEQLIFSSGPNTAVIGTFHTVPRSWPIAADNWLLGKWSYFSLKKFDSVVSVSPAAAQVARQIFNLETLILPNTIDYNRFKQASPLFKREKIQTILFLGRLIERKGALELLKAVNLLVRQNNEFKFRVVICGKGPFLPRLQAYVKSYQLEEIVDFVGFISEEAKPSYYASADICVFPALAGESFGVVLLEAMASGRSAVIAADNPGYASVLKNYPDQLFKRADASALASKLEQLLRNKHARMRIAQRGSDYAAGFDVKIVGNKLLDIYTAALLKKRA